MDLINEKFNFHCPKCDSIIEPETIGFYLCKYHVYGEKLNGDRLVSFDNGYEVANDKENLKYFRPSDNGEAFFANLIFEITEYY